MMKLKERSLLIKLLANVLFALLIITALTFYLHNPPVVIRASGGGSLFGIVIRPSGQNQPGMRYSPLEGAHVKITGPGGTKEAISDHRGGFQFNMIPPGDYTVTISKPGYGAYIAKVNIKNAIPENMGHIALRPGGGVSAPGDVLVPDTVFVALAKDRNNTSSSPTSLEQLRKWMYQDSGEFKPKTIGPYEKGHLLSTFENSLMVINPKDSSDINYIKLEGNPTWLCFNISGTRLYVAGDNSRISIYDILHNNIYIGYIQLSSEATDMKLSPDGRWLFVSNADGITIVDVKENVPVNKIEITSMSNGGPAVPMALTCSPDGKKIYVALWANDAGEVVAIDAYTRQPSERAMVGHAPTGIAISPDGRKLFVANNNSGDVAVLSTSPLKLLDRVSVGVSPARVAVSPDGKKVYVTCKGNGTLAILSGETGKYTGSVTVGKMPLGLAVTGDGSRIYVANNGDGDVSIIDAKTGHELRRTTPQPLSRPFGVAVKP